MDPIGPWYASCNRLATTPAVIAQPALSTTTAQLLLTAAGQTTTTLAGQSSSFNPGGFSTTPTVVGYDVFSPFFHTNNKQMSYVSQTTQPITQTEVRSTSKSDPPVEPDIPQLRSSYTSPQQNDTYFEHQSTVTSPSTVNWNLSHPTTAQITSPFGILPHESVAVSSPPDANTTKPESSINSAHTFFQSPNNFDSAALNSNFSANNQLPTNSTVMQSSYHQQSCIVSTPNITPSNRVTPRSPVLTTIYLSTSIQDKSNVQGNRSNPDLRHDSNQSSPISFSIIDSRNLNYGGASTTGTSGKPSAGTTSNSNVQQFHVSNQQANQQQQQQQSTPSSCRLVNSGTGTASDATEYHMPVRSKSATSTDSAYSSNTSQNGPDCAQAVVPRRPSPMQAHSQASPLGHVPSPATYPLYNSPIPNMSSPSSLQQHNDGASTPYKTSALTQQITPSSPLDASATRSPTQQGQVAYSSVITRALGSSDSSNKTVYNTDGIPSSRSMFNKSSDFSQSKQMCWDAEGQQSNDPQKFASSTYLATNASSSGLEAGEITLRNSSSYRQQRNMPSLSDNESDDQVQEQSVQEATIVVPASKNSQSLDKPKLVSLAPSNDYLAQIPAPTHGVVISHPQPAAAAVQQQHQSQQNGYIEFERWNLTTLSPAKILTPAATFTVQPQPAPQLHATANLVGAVSHQAQPILVTHHTPGPASVSYFPTYHVAPANHHMVAAPLHHQQQPQTHPTIHPAHQSMMTHEMHSTMGINSLNMVNAGSYQRNSTCMLDSMREDRPEVIRPNIEEELEYLGSGLSPPNSMKNQPVANPDLRRTSSNDPNSGFMTSYLKFLQGDKDTSPPPIVRGNRRNTWNNRTSYVSMETNGADAWGKNVSTSVMTAPASSEKSKEVTTIDYANDPRYFPLPKERKSQNFDSSDDGFSSDDELPSFSSKRKSNQMEDLSQIESNPVVPPPPVPLPVPNIGPDGRPKKGRPIKPGGPTDRKRKAAAAAAAKGIVLPLVAEQARKKTTQLPRRESSRRKAKENTSVKQMLDSQQTNDPYEVEEEHDSDSDPAWTPAAKPLEENEEKRRKRGRPVISKRRKLLDGELFGPEMSAVPKQRGRKRKHPIDPMDRSHHALKLSCKIDEKLLASVSDEDIDISPFKSGEFVVIKTDLGQEFPPLWRIDGKTLLQKYEPFQSNGKTLYRNISTYSGWAPQNRHVYQQVPIKFWHQGKMETIVEFLREDMIIDDSECISKFMNDTEKYQDNFEVYIQTLISQALDSNFLTEIFQEQDDYFLSNVKTVDEITEERKQRLLSTTSWQSNVVTALSTWPCINVLKDNIADYKGKSCAGCNRVKIQARVLLYGQPYNSTTLEGSPPDPQVPQEKDFLFCRLCQTKVALFNKVVHQKYLMFLECARRVADKRLADSGKDTTIILNELLADEAWLNQLFRDVRRIWAEIDSIHQQMKNKTNFTSNDVATNALIMPGIPSMPEISQLVSESPTLSYDSQMSDNLS